MVANRNQRPRAPHGKRVIFGPAATAARQAAERAVENATARELGRVVDEAQARWPTATGRSEASLRVQGPGVYSDVRYTEFIHGGRTWRELVVAPTEAAAEPIAREVANAVSSTLGGV